MPVERIALSKLAERVGYPIDVFICCGSFESRCLSVAEVVDADRIGKAIVGRHVTMHRRVTANTAKLMERFGAKAVSLELNSDLPIQSADRIADALATCRGTSPQHILIDVTTFTHESLLLLAELLNTAFSDRDDVRFVYTIAKDYAPGYNDEEKWLSKGIREIRSVLGYPGEMLPGRRIHLILLHGLEVERSTRVIAEYEPELLSLGRPEEAKSTFPKHISANRRVHAQVLKYARNTVEVEEFLSIPNDPHGLCEAILQQTELRDDLNIVAAPMSTKLSALGVGLAARSRPAIQICYAQPVRYNYDNYSTPSQLCYVFQMPEFLEGRDKTNAAL